MVEAILTLTLLGFTVASSAMAARQVLVSGSTEGLSAVTQAVLLSTNVAWTAYGSLNDHSVQIACGSVGIASSLVILGMGLRCRQFCLSHLSMVVGAFFVAVLFAAMFVGSAGLALVSSLVVAVARGPEIVEAWKRPGGSGISVPGFVTLAMVSVGWATFGLLAADPWIVGSSLYGTVQSAYMVVRTLQGRSNFVMQPVAAAEQTSIISQPEMAIEAA